MKKLIITIVLILPVILGYSQLRLFTNEPSEQAKADYKIILIYRTWAERMVYGDGVASSVASWRTEIQGFYSLTEVMSFINYAGYDGKPQVRLTENELIGIYDLRDAKKIELTLKTENKSLPKRVEIQAEKWTEQHYEIKTTP